MIQYSLLISLCIFLGGCCAPMPKPPKIDSYLMSGECSSLENVKEFKVFDHVLAQKAKDTLAYAECTKKYKGLAEAVKKYEVEFNANK